MKKSQSEVFDDQIWKNYSREDNYETLKFKLNRVRIMMMNSHESFRKFSGSRQFEYCVTIVAIAVQTSHKQLRQFRLSGDKNQVFPYSIEEGFSEPEIIDITAKRKLLK